MLRFRRTDDAAVEGSAALAFGVARSEDRVGLQNDKRGASSRAADDEPEITLVLSVRNQAEILGRALRSAVKFCADHDERCEVIVVDDASTDGSAAIAARWTEHFQALRVLRHEHERGKGAAIRAGVLVARGRRIVVAEPELAIDFEELAVLLEALDSGADVVVASRALADSEIVRGAPMLRRFIELLLGAAARCFVRPGVRDSFAGAQAFLKNCGHAIAGRAHSTGDGFAAEWIAIAQRLGLHVVEVPIRWANPLLGQTRLAFLPTLAELARASKRLKNAEYLAPLPAAQTLADTKFVRFEDARSGWSAQPDTLKRVATKYPRLRR